MDQKPEVEITESALDVLLTIVTVAPLLARTPATVRSQLVRSPQLLPPRARIPGTRRVLWFRSDVMRWLASFRQVRNETEARALVKDTACKRRGRPPKMLQGGAK